MEQEDTPHLHLDNEGIFIMFDERDEIKNEAKGLLLYIRTFGCQMNVRDAEFVMGLLLDNGFKKVDEVEQADVVLFNSCSVRKHAEDRLISNIASLAKLKKKKPGLLIGLMGCTAQNYKDKILHKAPLLDFVCGPGNEVDLPNIIKDVYVNRLPIVAVDKVDKKRTELFPKYREQAFKAFVSISEGCNNFCSYCIVPYVRGRERSREASNIIKEIKDLAARGFKEITLLGQNVNSYQGQGSRGVGQGFVGLLGKINKIDGIERIRFMTSHPKDAHVELFKAVRDLDKVCEHLHLPLQSGSDKILKRMNRGYTAKKYLKLASDYKKFVPEGSITTDIIVGFPSETEADFCKTVDVMKEVGFDSSFAFKYSPRPPAKASKLEDDVSKEEKERRLKIVLDLQCAISEERNKPLLGKVVEVLVDGQSEKDPKYLVGRTRTNKAAIFEGEKSLVGKLVNMKVESVRPHTLIGKVAA